MKWWEFLGIYLLGLALNLILIKYGIEADDKTLMVFLALIPIMNIPVAGVLIVANLFVLFLHGFIFLANWVR